MEWLTDLLNDPAIKQGGALGALYIIYQLGVLMFKWQTTEAQTEGKEADADSKRADAERTQQEAFNNIALAMGTIAQTNQNSSEAFLVASQNIALSSKAIQEVAKTVADMRKEVGATHAAQTQTLEQITAKTAETGAWVQGVTDKMATNEELRNLGDKIDVLIDEVRQLRDMVGDVVLPRLNMVEQQLPPIQGELQSIIQRQTSEMPAVAPPPNKPKAAPSKTQARVAQIIDTLIVGDDPLPQETPNKPVNDIPPTGG